LHKLKPNKEENTIDFIGNKEKVTTSKVSFCGQREGYANHMQSP